MLITGCHGCKWKGILHRPRGQGKPPDRKNYLNYDLEDITKCQLLLSTMGKGERKNILRIETRMYKDQELNEDMTCSRDSGATVCICRGIECDKEARRYKAGELSRHQKMRLS